MTAPRQHLERVSRLASRFTLSACVATPAVGQGAEILGGFLAGRMLDAAAAVDRRRAAQRTLVLFLAFTATGYGFALSKELPAALHHGGVMNTTGLGDVAILPSSAAFFFWGLSYSQVQLYVMWLIGVCYPAGAIQARAVGCFKMVQSLGWCIGFALVPSDRVPPIIQLCVTYGCSVVGVAVAWRELPGARAKVQGLGDGLLVDEQ